MSWDRATLETEVQNEVDDFEADSLTNIRQFINDICRVIWFRHDWSFREGTGYITTDGVNSKFTIASTLSNFGKVLAVGYKGPNDTTYNILTFLPYDQFIERYRSAAPVVGTPTVWTLYAGQVIFDTIPNSGSNRIELTYEINFTDLTAGSDTPLIPEKYKHVIKSGVKASFWDSDDDLRGPSEWLKFQGPSYLNGIGGLIGDMILEDNEQKIGPHMIRPMGGGRVVFGRR